MEVVNAIVHYYGIFKEVMLFIRPAVVILLVLASLFEVLVYSVQYKYNIFPQKLAEKIEYYNARGLNDKTRMIRKIYTSLVLLPFYIYFMYGDTFINGIFQTSFVFLALLNIMRILYFTYQVFSPYWKQART